MLNSRQNEPNTGAIRPSIDDGEWRPPGGYQDVNRWALENRTALEQYTRQNEKYGTAAEQLERYLAEHPEALNGGHAEV